MEIRTSGGDLTQTEIETLVQKPEIRLEIIEDGLRKKYLSRLEDMPVIPVDVAFSLEKDVRENVRLYQITEMVYPKGEFLTDKFYTVFSTLSTFRVSIFIIVDSDGKKTDFYIGVRNNEINPEKRRTTVMFGNMLQDTLIGQFPGIKIQNVDRSGILPLSQKIANQRNVASVSVVAGDKITKEQRANEKFVQGLEKLVLAMQGRQYTGVIIAENQSSDMIQVLRRNYQDLYTKLSPLQKVQFSTGIQSAFSESQSEAKSSSVSKAKSFSEMDGKQKSATIGGALVSLIGVGLGAYLGTFEKTIGAVGGGMLGGQTMAPIANFINSLAPNEQLTEGVSTTSTATTTTTSSKTLSTTTEHKMVTELMRLLDDSLKRMRDFDSYGMWNVAGYFSSDDMATAEIAASNYRSLMSGENSEQVLSAVNSWRDRFSDADNTDVTNLAGYLSHFCHPMFCYGSDNGLPIDATAWVSGKELGLHLGFPRSSIPGMPVIEHAEFGKEVYVYQTIAKDKIVSPRDRMTLGKVFDLGAITDKIVELDNKSLNMHTFITGSTGSGKSNTVYQMLSELYQDEIPFLVIEPAKGEYKDVFGNWEDVNVFSTNPNIAPLINLNPFKFPESIHVLEHVDGLVEIFSVCWPMYDAMPAFFKDAILKSYEEVGWDLGSSTFEGNEIEYPDFDVVVEQLDRLIEQSGYASDIKSNYRGALITRVKSLTIGLNKFIFTSNQTPYEQLFDQNCILDISRVKSNETKALLMGLVVYILNEYRVDKKDGNNGGLRHVTVLEEAHNLLKNTSGGKDSELVGKSVEMLTQTIAEIRTYGEGFIIVDQSPSSVDVSAIKNTNTKIVLRMPEKSDREAVGRSVGLSDDQINEIARLPSGVAVVYQNNWVNPVLAMIDKADIEEGQTYQPPYRQRIRNIKSARANLIAMLMQPWTGGNRIHEDDLIDSLNVLDLRRSERQQLADIIGDYALFAGHLSWSGSELERVRKLILIILGISETDGVLKGGKSELSLHIRSKMLVEDNLLLDVMSSFLTTVGGDNEHV